MSDDGETGADSPVSPDTRGGPSALVEDDPPREWDSSRGVLAKDALRLGRPRKRDLDKDRYWLAWGVLGAFCAASAAAFIILLLAPEAKLETFRSFTPLVLGPLSTLTGTGFAWFYAERSASRSDR